MKLNEKIQLLRKQKGWTQEELAEMLSLSRQALSKWESGTATPDAKNLLKLSKCLGVSMEYLLDDGQDMPPQQPVKPKLPGKVSRLIEEKGYIAGYILAGQSLLGLIVDIFICCACLSPLLNIAPLQEFPPQAFLIPILCALVGVLLIVRIVLYLRLAHKLKQS